MAEFIQAASSNYKVGRDGNNVRFIIIHTVVGSQNSAIGAFLNPARIASAHYIVDKTTNRLVQMVREEDTAYHAGNWSINLQSIGIEHADDGDYNGVRPDILYNNSAALVADLCRRYGIPCNRDYIKKHTEVSLTGTACPDALDIDRIVRQAFAILNPPAPTPVPQPVPTPAPFTVSYTRFTEPRVKMVNKPTQLWDFNHPGWDFPSIKMLVQGEEFVAVGQAVHSNGGIYYMTAFSFGQADITGIPTHTWGANKVDLSDYPIPIPIESTSTSTTSSTSSTSTTSSSTTTPPPIIAKPDAITVFIQFLIDLIKKIFRRG